MRPKTPEVQSQQLLGFPPCAHRQMMAPTPYVKTNKNDAADAEAICEAVARPNMRFCVDQECRAAKRLALHRVRQGFVKARMAQANQVRDCLVSLAGSVAIRNLHLHDTP